MAVAVNRRKTRRLFSRASEHQPRLVNLMLVGKRLHQMKIFRQASWVVTEVS